MKEVEKKMPKKYRYILAWIAIIGMVAAVWFWGFYRQPTLWSCLAGALTAAGGCAANLLWRAYIDYETWRCGRK